MDGLTVALIVSAVVNLVLVGFCIVLASRAADAGAWQAAFSSRLVEIAFRETITMDAHGAERAPAPPDPAEREDAPAEVLPIEAAIERMKGKGDA